MNWESARSIFPDRWILFEAIESHSENGKRVIDRLAVINSFNESKEALNEYKLIHKKEPNRELYVAHTSNDKLDIIERKWLGVRI